MEGSLSRLRRGFPLGAILLLTLCSRAGLAAQPNILLIVADDVGAEASSLYQFAGKSGAAPMPTLEKIAARGLVFENAWVNPMCSPTRATIVSGLYGFLGAQISDYYNWTAWDGNTGTSTPITTYSTTALTDWALDFMRKHEASRPKDPWFIYMPYNAAHAPFQVPPDNLHSLDVGGQEAGTRAATVPVYKAMIQALDSEIGRLLKNVDLNNTLVIYVGDNGTPGNVKDEGARVRGSKMSTWEGGVRVPLTIAGAGVTRSGREAALVNGVDLYATIAAAAGIPVKHVNDAYSLVPLFTDARASTGRDYAFTKFCTGQTARFAIRDRTHKLIYDSANGWGLYNLDSDVGEDTNLYDNPGFAAVQAKLKAALAVLNTAPNKGCFK